MAVTVKGQVADSEQLAVIRGALGEAHQLGASERVMIAVVMCMTQESDCRALHGGDRDSVGPFQQRDPWGPASVREDPAGSCRLFLTGGETGEPGWTHYFSLTEAPVDLGAAVQKVQVSAFPTAYAQWESEATRTVAWWLSTLPSMHYDRYLKGGERTAASRYDHWRERQTAKAHPHRAWMLMRKAQCRVYARRIELGVAWDQRHRVKDPWDRKNRRFRHAQLEIRARGGRARPS